jgi:hypothetical protein
MMNRTTAQPHYGQFIALPLYCLLWCIAAQYAVVADDVVWQLWVADQLNHGFVLYRDLRETNPPLWFWLAALVQKSQTVLPFALVPLYFAFVSLMSIFSLGLSAWILRDLDKTEQLAWLFGLATAIFGFGFFIYGQREHLCLIFGMPYALLISARMRLEKINTRMAILVGSFAVFGFALKHYFLLIPIFLEIGLLAKQRTIWRPIRLETVALSVLGLVYGIAIWQFTPDYVTKMIPMVQLAYSAFQKEITTFIAPTIMALAGIYLALRVCTRERSIVLCIALFSGALWLAYIIQRKGWLYQELPIFIPLLALAIAAIVHDLIRRAKWTKSLPFALYALVVGGYCIVFGWRNAATALNPPPFPVALGPDKKVAWIGASGSENIQHVLREGGQWTQGYVTLWPLLTIAQSQMTGNRNPQIAALAAQLRRDHVADMLCQQPDLIMIASSAGELVYGGKEFDQLGFFLQDPAFKTYFNSFAHKGKLQHITFFERSRDAQKKTSCKQFHAPHLFPQATSRKSAIN